MKTIIEMNVQTGEKTEREMTQEDIDAIPPAPPAEPPIDPVVKLKAFLASNPDVAALLQ